MFLSHADHEFDVVIDAESRILILGSFPSVLSRNKGFYYMNPKNRFWSVLSEIFQEDFVSVDIQGKLNLLHRHHIALYDVVESCDLQGSADSSIKNIIVADLDKIIRSAPIRKIYLNGSKAYILFSRYFPQYTSMAVMLPSTSSANAIFSFDDLLEKWKVIR